MSKQLEIILKPEQLNKIPLNEQISYKYLTELLNQKYLTGGNQKEAQLTEFSRYFNFEFLPNRKMIIKEIYDEPKPKVYHYPINTIYSECIEKILTTYLAGRENDNGTTYISSQYLYLVLGMINDEYINMQRSDNKTKLKDDLRAKYSWGSTDVKESSINFYVNDFYKRSKLKFHSIVETSLKSLQRQRLLEYSHVYHLFFEETNDDGTVIVNNYDYYTDDNDTRIILGIEREVLLELGYRNEFEALSSPRSKEYYERITEKAKEIFVGLTGLYRCYKFIYIRENFQKVLDSNNQLTKKLDLNQKVMKFINDQTNKNYLSTEKIEYGEGFKYTKNYSAAQYYLSNRLIKLRVSTNKECKEDSENIVIDEEFENELNKII